MSPLRQQMVELMTYRNMSPRTIEAYINGVSKLSQYYHRSPDKITADEVQQ